MDLSLTESESKYYNDLFTLCDVEKIGKVQKLKSDEFFRSAELEEDVLLEVSGPNQYQMQRIYRVARVISHHSVCK
jgi:hypothetical protein